MSIFDELKGKAEELKDKATGLLHDNSEKISGAIDQAGDFVDEKTGGKFAEHVDKVQDGAKGLLDKVDGDDEAPTA
ncbi:antitoxin [Paeniglutamicibacter sp. NPDC012692]|uniref:antitoxin n=1 Tax=Paeniglutamicibacter sp. NPDC012692 TaxID=3364388 RepID=UPI00369CCD21